MARSAPDMADATQETTPLDPATKQAIRLLRTEAGTRETRGAALIRALRAAFADEAIGTMLETWPAGGTVVDQRVARFDAIVGHLDAQHGVPTRFELGVMLRITPAQAGNVIRTYQARHPARLRQRMMKRITSITPKAIEGGKKYSFQFEDEPTLSYAAESLRRQGLSRGMKIDDVELTLVIDQKLKVGGEEHDPHDVLIELAKSYEPDEDKDGEQS